MIPLYALSSASKEEEICCVYQGKSPEYVRMGESTNHLDINGRGPCRHGGFIPVEEASNCLLEVVTEGSCSPSYDHYFPGKTTEMAQLQ